MNSISATPAASCLTRLVLARPLAVGLRRAADAPPLACAPVSAPDLSEVASEAWRDGCLRAGRPQVPLAGTPMVLAPILADGSEDRCAGFSLQLALPGGQASSVAFTFHCLRHVAERAIAQLVEVRVLKQGETCLFDVVVDPRQTPPRPPGGEPTVARFSLRTPPLTYLTVSLRKLLARATPVALLDDEVFPVFYTQEAFARCEACARRGEKAGVESGGALFGSLASCPESGEFCAIIRDVIEIQDADEAKFSLAYSSRSWHRLQQIQQARQTAFPQHADRLLGQAHGHPFRPNDGKLCAECEKRATCMLSSAWVSQDDQSWHRAVFARQPWALCHVFGLTARGEPVHQLFGLKDGGLKSRGFYLLPDFTCE